MIALLEDGKPEDIPPIKYEIKQPQLFIGEKVSKDNPLQTLSCLCIYKKKYRRKDFIMLGIIGPKRGGYVRSYPYWSCNFCGRLGNDFIYYKPIIPKCFKCRCAKLLC